MRADHVAIIASVVLTVSTPSLAGPPEWATRDTQRLSGSRYEVVCSGEGPSVDIARKEALNGCKMSAAQQVQTTFQSWSLSVQTERDTAFHQEVIEQSNLRNFRCEPMKEAIEDLSGGFRLWLRCAFNLDAVDAEKVPSPANPKVPDQVQSRVPIRSVAAKNTTYVRDEFKTVSIASVPKCDDVLVTGTNGTRVIRCMGNPTVIRLNPAETDLTIRASRHLPKKVRLNSEGPAYETVNVLLTQSDQ